MRPPNKSFFMAREARNSKSNWLQELVRGSSRSAKKYVSQGSSIKSNTTTVGTANRAAAMIGPIPTYEKSWWKIPVQNVRGRD